MYDSLDIPEEDNAGEGVAQKKQEHGNDYEE